MDTDTCFLPPYIWTTDPIPVTPVFGAFGAEDERTPERAASGPVSPPEGALPLTFWTDGRVLASSWYRASAHKAICKSPLFSGPVQLALEASFPVLRPGWMRVSTAAVSGDEPFVLELLRLYADKHIAVPLTHVGHGRIGLPLGLRWFPVPPELSSALLHDTEDTRARVARFARQAFDVVVFGDDAARAIRLLESIPGIRGERPDPVC